MIYWACYLTTRVGKYIFNFLNMKIFSDSQVKDILQHYPDLVNGFNEFLEHCENTGGSHVTLCNVTCLDAFL